MNLTTMWICRLFIGIMARAKCITKFEKPKLTYKLYELSDTGVVSSINAIKNKPGIA